MCAAKTKKKSSNNKDFIEIQISYKNCMHL